MSDDASTTGPSASEAVAELLRQLVDARYVLTDRDGGVTRWSRPAEELFGWPAARMLGRSLVKTLGSVTRCLPAVGSSPRSRSEGTAASWRWRSGLSRCA